MKTPARIKREAELKAASDKATELFNEYAESVCMASRTGENTWFDGGMIDFAEFIILEKGYTEALSTTIPQEVTDKLVEALENIDDKCAEIEDWAHGQFSKELDLIRKYCLAALTNYQSFKTPSNNGTEQ